MLLNTSSQPAPRRSHLLRRNVTKKRKQLGGCEVAECGC